METFTIPMPIMIKEEVLSDSEEVHCRLCHKAFASPIALRNHARMDHIEAYESGDPMVWTKPDNDPVVMSKNSLNRDPKIIIQKRKQEILSSMTPTNMTSLADNNVSYIIIKAEDYDGKVRKVVKKEKEHKPTPPKKIRTQQVITGPFECLEASSAGADGACHQIFFSCCEYSLHGRTEHSRRRRAARCQVCERPLASRPNDPTAPFACESCGDGFASAEELQEHTNKLHVKLKPYECGVCHKRFTQQGGVLQHMRMHTGDRPFPCSHCGKAFTQKSGLDQHLRTHTKHKPYRCVVCAKAFIQSVHLKQHMRTHTNVAPFQCGICDKRFKQSSHLNYHLKNHNPTNMTAEQKDKYRALIGQIAANGHAQLQTEEKIEIEIPQATEEEQYQEEEQEEEEEEQEEQEEVQEMVQEMSEEMVQVLAEEDFSVEDKYIIGNAYGE